MFKLTNNEVQFVCWGALTTVYLSIFVLIATVSRELLLAPMFGVSIATPMSAMIAIALFYSMIWHFVCHTNIPKRSWAKWFVGVQLATVFIIIETALSKGFMHSDQGFAGEAYSVFSQNYVITFVLISIIVAPKLLAAQRDQSFNL